MNRVSLPNLAAIVYIGLGTLLHLQAAFSSNRLGALLGDRPVLRSRRGLLQHAWNLSSASVAGDRHRGHFGIGATARGGYWVNTVLVTPRRSRLIFFVLVPGLVPMWPGLLGPLNVAHCPGAVDGSPTWAVQTAP